MIITNEQSGERVIIDPYEFTNCLSMLKKEVVMFKAALKQGQERAIKLENDPVTLLFDKSFLLGNAYIFPEFMAYGLGTDDAEKETDIHSTLAPFNKVNHCSCPPPLISLSLSLPLPLIQAHNTYLSYKFDYINRYHIFFRSHSFKKGMEKMFCLSCFCSFVSLLVRVVFFCFVLFCLLLFCFVCVALLNYILLCPIAQFFT